MAMKHPRITVFSGAIFALGLMTVLSGKTLFCNRRKNWKESFLVFSSFWNTSTANSSCLYVLHINRVIRFLWSENAKGRVLHER